MIEITRTKTWELPGIFALYQGAFPSSERKPFSIIVKRARTEGVDLWTIRAHGRFAGFAATVNSPQIVLLDYLAVKKNLRSRGVGREAMALLNEAYRDRGFFVEIESTFENAPNARERQKRKEFYVNCGMTPMGTEADLFGVRMELLGIRCHLDFESYRNFYRDNYSPRAAERVREVQP